MFFLLACDLSVVVDIYLNCILFSNGSIKIDFRIVVQLTQDMKPNEVKKKVVQTLIPIKEIGGRNVSSIEYKGLFRVSIKNKRFILDAFRHLCVRSSFFRSSISQSVSSSVSLRGRP